MGVHVGEGSERGRELFRTAVNRAARLMSVAHGGQVVCSRGGGVGGRRRVSWLIWVSIGCGICAAAETCFRSVWGRFRRCGRWMSVPTKLPTVRTELIGRSAEVADLGRARDAGAVGDVDRTGWGGQDPARPCGRGVGGRSIRRRLLAWWSWPHCRWDRDRRTAVVRAMGAQATYSRIAGGLPGRDRQVLLVARTTVSTSSRAAADLVDGVLAAGGDVH